MLTTVLHAKFSLIDNGAWVWSPKILNLGCVGILPVLQRLSSAYDF